MAILVILGIRTYQGEEVFTDWGWRIPFLLSAVLLAVSIWIRLSLNESPMFQQMKAEGERSKAPLTEAFGTWSNAKIAILALLGATAGEAVVWYGGQFYALFFLTQTLKVPAVNAQIMIAIGLRSARRSSSCSAGSPTRSAASRSCWRASCLAAVTYFPIFQRDHLLRQPGALRALQASSPVSVVADPADCSLQLKLTGTEKYTSSCDIATAALVAKSVNYDVVDGPRRHAGADQGRRHGDRLLRRPPACRRTRRRRRPTR